MPLELDPRIVRLPLLGMRHILDAIPQDDLDALFAQSLAAAAIDFERATWFSLTVRRIKVRGTPGLGVDYDQEEEQYDLDRTPYARLGFFRTRWRPVMSVERISVEFGRDRTILTYPESWIRLNARLGHISIVPVLGRIEFGQVGGDYWLPLLNGSPIGGLIPQIVSIDYTAGIADLAEGAEWAKLRQMLGKRAAIDVCQSLTELIPVASSIDGASTQVADYAQKLQAYATEWEAFKRDFTAQYSPIHMVVA